MAVIIANGVSIEVVKDDKTQKKYFNLFQIVAMEMIGMEEEDI